MKRKNIFIGVLVAALALAGYLTFYYFSRQSKIVTTATGGIAIRNDVAKCTDKPPLGSLKTSETHLEKLADYQKTCGSFVTDKLMFFISFPENEVAANQNAVEIANRLKLFEQSGITPLVIVEPYLGSNPMPYTSYLAGKYDSAVAYFFKRLKALGIRDDMMGTWVPFPESNTPLWDNKNTAPKDFALCVNKYLSEMKRHFPKAKGSVLLNSMTYTPTDTDWAHGKYASLSDYVKPLDKQLVSSIGIQGFPWISHDKNDGPAIDRASEFLQPGLAVGAARTLGTYDIWINTGTFGAKYVNDPAKTVRHSARDRQVILEDSIGVAKSIREQRGGDTRVSINLFSENKSDTEEATDWSYLGKPDSTAVFKGFIARAHELDISVSLFDEAK